MTEKEIIDRIRKQHQEMTDRQLDQLYFGVDGTKNELTGLLNTQEHVK